MGDPQGTINQLNAARDIVLKDAAIYPQVVPGVLPVISAQHPVQLRRWGADFLAETFASPVLNAEEKQKLALAVLDTLKGYLDRGEEEDESVVKGAVQAAGSIYPLVFRNTISNPEDAETWAKMASIKSNILKRMDNAPGGVRMCCIMFVARVVQVQTPGVIADPRRGEQNEISLALVPRDHKIFVPSNLEAEASGLLDRLLGVLQDNISDPLIATATLNALASLVQRRASISTKILTTVLAFNPLKLAENPMTGKEKVAVRSMTRTTMSFLLNVLKRNPNHALAGRIQAQVERLRQRLTEVFSDQNPLKRGAPDEPIDGLSAEKRQRLDAEMEGGGTPQNPQYPPLPPGPVTVAQLFNLTPDQNASGFHVEVIPAQFVSQLVPHLLTAIDQHRFDTAVNVVRARMLELQRRPPPGTGEADDMYTPPPVDGEETPPGGFPPLPQHMLPLGSQTFHLPPPKPLSEQERLEFEETAKDRLFESLHRLEVENRSKAKKATVEKEKGFNRLAAASSQDRDGWITLVTRLATRSSLPSEDENDTVKREGEDAITKKNHLTDLPGKIRDAFNRYIMDDWRPRIDIAIAWLNEEWYADTLLSKPNSSNPLSTSLPNYTAHTVRLLDSLLPYLDKNDGRYLVRLLSEIPHLPPEIFERIQKIALDPERVKLSTDLLTYLVMFRPPVRQAGLDCLEAMWRENSDARGPAARILVKWRPDVVKKEEGGEEGGMKEE